MIKELRSKISVAQTHQERWAKYVGVAQCHTACVICNQVGIDGQNIGLMLEGVIVIKSPVRRVVVPEDVVHLDSKLVVAYDPGIRKLKIRQLVGAAVGGEIGQGEVAAHVRLRD